MINVGLHAAMGRAWGVTAAVFPTRRGLLPAVRVFTDYLAENLPALL